MHALRAITLLLVLAAALGPSTAAAIADPDTRFIVAAYGYGDVLEANDILLLIWYHVDYSTLPEETAAQSVVGRYVDDAGQPVRAATPYVYVRSGYGQGVMSIYFNAADAGSLAITHGELAQASLAGNPGLFVSPWMVTTSVTWRVRGSQAALEADVANIADALEIRSEWSGMDLVTILSGRRVLTSVGEDYFMNAIPGLRSMAPNLFNASLTSAQFIERDYTQSYAQELENTWAGTRFENIFAAWADWWNVPQDVLETVVWLLLGLAAGGTLAMFVMQWGVSETAASGLMFLVAAVIIILAARLGWFSVQFLGIIGVLSAGLLTYVLFLKRA
ncbi:MAG: hypothetical protein KatS3mg051_2250 [Anaerolineae bacterium]|nr:MAG: hypothetical protein KatS3mg051_2250 [Anaerolineae bacterium]